MMSTSHVFLFHILSSPHVFLIFSPPTFAFISLSSVSFPLCLIPLCLLLDHSPQTVEACVWWIGWEPQQYKRSHVYAQTLREVSYYVWHLHMTRYCYACTHGTVCIAQSVLPPNLLPHTHLHQIGLHSASFITLGQYKTNIDLTQRMLMQLHTHEE